VLIRNTLVKCIEEMHVVWKREGIGLPIMEGGPSSIPTEVVKMVKRGIGWP
jgi:hypothetical protein